MKSPCDSRYGRMPTPEPLRAVRIGRVRDIAHLAWAEGEVISLPAALLDRGPVAAALASDGTLEVSAALAPAVEGVADALRMRAAYTGAPVSGRLPVSYQRIPPVMRQLMAGAVGRLQRHRSAAWARYPRFPLDLTVDAVADLAAAAATDGVPPRETAAAATPVVLSHDLDSPEGLQNLVSMFLPVEESVGARSTSFIVPCAWPVDHGLLAEVQARGHEIGIHGYDHANRTPHLPAEERRTRLAAAGELIAQYGCRGYRAPSLVRTSALLDDLAPLYRYDSSIPTSGGLFPTPNNGCATARPFRIGRLLEIPLSMPRDGSLRFLGYSPRAILDLWKATAQRIARSRGVVVLLTHCEARFSGNRAMLGAYEHFLRYLAETPEFRFVTAAGLAAEFNDGHG